MIAAVVGAGATRAGIAVFVQLRAALSVRETGDHRQRRPMPRARERKAVHEGSVGDRRNIDAGSGRASQRGATPHVPRGRSPYLGACTFQPQSARHPSRDHPRVARHHSARSCSRSGRRSRSTSPTPPARRAGFLQKISKRGWVCKTWEGELQMIAVPGSTPEKFLFTVRSDSVAAGAQSSRRPACGARLQAAHRRARIVLRRHRVLRRRREAARPP